MIYLKEFSLHTCLSVFLLSLGMVAAVSGRRLAAQEPKITYLYDDLGRLIRVINEDDECATYAYDAVGNILSITRSTDCRQPPAVDSLPPVNLGETACISITGSNLLGATISTDNPAIQVSDVQTSESSVEVCLTVSAQAPLGPTELVITTPVGAVSTTLTVLGFLPRVSGIFPAQGPFEGGTPVSLSGVHLTPDTTVLIGGNPATDVVFVNASVLTARTPAGSPGLLADVVVQNNNGSTTLAGGFHYTLPFSVPGAITLAIGSAGLLPVTLARPESVDTIIAVASADAMVVTVPASTVIPAGTTSVGIPLTTVGEGTTTVTVTIGETSLAAAIFVTQPFTGPLELLASSVGIVVGEPPLASIVGALVAPTLPVTLVLSSGATHTTTVSLAAPAPPGGLCVTIELSNPAIATVPDEVCIDEGSQSVVFDVTALSAGETFITVRAGAEVRQLQLLVDRTPAIPAAGLAAPVGVLVQNEVLNVPVGVLVVPNDAIQAPIVGVEVQ